MTPSAGAHLPKGGRVRRGLATRDRSRGITDVLFGPGFTGKLPVSWPNAVTDEPINSGDAKTPLFALGYGLSPY